MATPSTLCVYPLSPTYLVLHRYLYYLSLLLSVLYPTPPPLIKGAFAFSLTYSSTAALYAILILAAPLLPAPVPSASPSPVPILNLDVLTLWAILSPASILLLPLLTWSRALQGARSKSARPIIRIWGVLVLVGTACTFALLQKLPIVATGGIDDPSSAPSDCQALAAASAQKVRLRDPLTAMAVAYERIFNPLYTILATRLAPLTFIPLAFGALSCLLSSPTAAPPPPSTPHKSAGTAHYLPSSSASQPWQSISVTSTDPMSTSPLSMIRNAFLVLRRGVRYLTPAWLVPVVVVNELFLLRGGSSSTTGTMGTEMGVPEAEKMYEVGQWGLLAGLALVSAAAGVSWFAGRGKEGEGGSEREERMGGSREGDCIA